MQSFQGAHGFRSGGTQALCKQSSASLPVKTLSPKCRGHVPALFSSRRGRRSTPGLSAGQPQLHALTFQPSLKPVQSESRHCPPVFPAPAGWSTKQTLREHEQFTPLPFVAVVGHCSKGSGQNSCPHRCRACAGTCRKVRVRADCISAKEGKGRPSNSIGSAGIAASRASGRQVG